MPLAGMLLARLPSPVVGALVALTAFWSWPALMSSRDHPLVGDRSVIVLSSHAQMFVNTPDLGNQYRQAAQHAGGVGCSEVGLHLGADDAEYPWWRMIQSWDGGRRVEHVGVVNPTATLAQPGGAFQPCIVLSRRSFPGDAVSLDGRDYSLERRAGQVAVLRPVGELFPIEVNFSAQPPAQWVAEEPQRVQVAVANIGSRTWPATGPQAVQLSMVLSSPPDVPPNMQPRETRVPLPADLAPGSDWTAAAELLAPAEPGKYVVRHRLIHGLDSVHPLIQQDEITVVQPPAQRRRRR
jgi:hypothetical protein